MKKRNLLSGLLLAVGLTLGIAGTAHANTFSSCTKFNNNDPAAPTGDVTITNSGACSLSNPALGSGLNSLTVTSTGAITTSTAISTPGAISLTGTAVTTNNVTSTGNSVYLDATTGAVTAANITGNGSSIQVMAPGGKITVTGTVSGNNLTQIYSAKTTIKLQAVNNANGDVRIFAQQGGGSTVFKVGASTTNSVMSINNNSTSGGGRNIYISNGAGSGGINYNGANLLQVKGSGSAAAGSVILDGKAAGNVTLTGSISADGTGGPSGVIEIYAPQVISNGTTTLSASAPGQNVGYINLVTGAITVNAGALNLNINGNGPFTAYTDLSLFPVGSHTVMASTDPNTPITFGPYAPSAKPLAITGAGTLTINANGNTNGMKIYGYPLTLTAKTRINQKGSGNSIDISGSDGTNNLSTITFGGDIQVHENTGAASDGQGMIALAATSISGVSKNVLLDASGAAGTGGDGSNINLTTSSGALSLGDTATDIALNANGSTTGGKGGIINVFGGTTAVTIKSGNAVVASAQGGNGDAGYIDIESTSISNGSGASFVNADAKGTGNGDISYPNIKIVASSGTLNLGTGAGKLLLSASGSDGKGNGGSIELANLQAVTLANALSVSAGTNATGNGMGGTLNFHDLGGFTVTGSPTVTADSHGTGLPGNITITSFGSNPMTLNNATISASGDIAGGGSGGNINISNAGPITVDGATLKANGTGAGNAFGGSIQITTPIGSGNAVDLSQASTLISATGATNGAGGNVIISNSKEFDVNTVVNVDAGSGTLANTGIFAGIIQLNNVPCRQWHTGYDYPVAYWNCTPNNTSHEQVPAATAFALTGLKTRLTTNSNVLYVFTNAASLSQYFAAGPSSPVSGGFTFNLLANGTTTTKIYVNVFENGTIGDNLSHAYTDAQLSEVAGHELGHLVNITFSGGVVPPAYTAYAYRDFYNLDYVLDTTVMPNAPILRKPCATTYYGNGTPVSDAPPFLGITNISNGHPVCVGGVLNPADYPNLHENSFVLANLEGLLLTAAYEIKAQAFTHQLLGTQGARPMFDAVIDRSTPLLLGGTYFGCIKAWATAELSNLNGPATVPDSCGVLEPGYTPFL
ncbi:hypothetical protein BH10CYA1_BH10CYA1_59470 [soil metagenome]